MSVYGHRVAPKPRRINLGSATLEIKIATRAKIAGQLTFRDQSIELEGRILPGSPAVVTLHEIGKGGKRVADGLQAILYIPPWQPTVDYSYDLIMGTMSVGQMTAFGVSNLKGTLLELAGIQPFE